MWWFRVRNKDSLALSLSLSFSLSFLLFLLSRAIGAGGTENYNGVSLYGAVEEKREEEELGW